MAVTHVRWTADEIDLLTRLYGTMPVTMLQQRHFPHRTMKSVSVKAGKLGLTASLGETAWTEDEKRILLDNPGMTGRELQERYFPDRTVMAVLDMRAKMRRNEPTASRPASYDRRPWSEDELKLLHELYGTMSAQELQEKHFPDRTLRSIRQAAYIRPTVGAKRATWTPDDNRALRENYGRMPVSHMPGSILPTHSRRAIENQVTKLGLRAERPKTKPHSKKYAKEDTTKED